MMRIVTYNTRGSLGMDNRRSTTRIVETLRPYSPDVVCFQEIHQLLPWSGHEDQPKVLAQQLARQFLFQRNLRIGFGGYGIGIACRGVLRAQTREHLLPSGKEQRGMLEARLSGVDGFPIFTVFCTHWGLEAAERREQAEAVAEILSGAPVPYVLCGDLNEGPGGDAVRLLLSRTGLIDSDAADNRPTFASDRPTERIDYVLHAPNLLARRVEVIASLASDHLPVLVDLEPV
jgi:endonuclease/exonuclease/phosphatase family metal-dependent hydrolase